MHAHTHTHVSMHACQHAQTRSGTARAHTSVSTAPQAHMCTPACAHTPHARALCTHTHRGHTRTGAHTHTRAHAHIPCAPMRSPAHGTHAAHAHTNKHAHNPSLDVVLQSSLTSTGLQGAPSLLRTTSLCSEVTPRCSELAPNHLRLLRGAPSLLRTTSVCSEPPPSILRGSEPPRHKIAPRQRPPRLLRGSSELVTSLGTRNELVTSLGVLW